MAEYTASNYLKATALKLGTAEAQQLLRRFVRTGTLRVIDAGGTLREFAGTPDGPAVTMRLHSRLLPWRLFFNPELAVGAGAVPKDLEGVLHFGAAAKIIDDIIDEGDKLVDEVAGEHFGLPAKVDELAVDAVADGAPLVLLD